MSGLSLFLRVPAARLRVVVAKHARAPVAEEVVLTGLVAANSGSHAVSRRLALLHGGTVQKPQTVCILQAQLEMLHVRA